MTEGSTVQQPTVGGTRSADAPAGGTEPPRRRRRRIVTWLGIAVLLIAGGAVGAVLLTRPSHHPHATKAPPPISPTATGFQQALLSGREGFGRNTTGGAGGPIVHVTSDADSGAGTLRAAVAGDRPAWVIFDRDMTIHLTEPIDVGSNKTIDGRQHRVELTGHGTWGLRIRDVSNVIVANMILHDFGDVTKTAQNDKPDAIDIIAVQNAWIDHCDLSMAGNKLILVDKGSTGVTVSWNHFHDQEQTFQIGDQANKVTDAKQVVTVDHNYFDHTAYRNPVVSYGKAHVYNNYVVGWTVWGVTAQRLGQMYLERNVFEASGNKKASRVKPAKNGCNDANTRCDDAVGFLNAVDNLTENGATLQTSDPAAVFNPAQYYAYHAQPATPALAHEIVADAGWQPGLDLPRGSGG
jgi:pectate lyase